jgi:hypothetical protein
VGPAVSFGLWHTVDGSDRANAKVLLNMFYIFNVKHWLEEVITRCNENNLNPEESIFVLLLFSSLDFEFVDFFKARRPQISQYSGENVHIFTPMVFNDKTVPDNEWRIIRQNFVLAHMNFNNRPSAVLFKLRKRDGRTGYDPDHFAAFELPSFNKFQSDLPYFVEMCIAYRNEPQLLSRKLTEHFMVRNRVERSGEDPFRDNIISRVLHAPRVFVSYSHKDKDTVLRLSHQLKKRKIELWLDHFEIFPGDIIQEKIELGLSSSDAILVCLSKNSEKSKWLPFESTLFYGRNETKKTIPVILDQKGKALAREMPSLKDRMYVDISNPKSRQKEVAKLAAVLSKL